MIDKTNQYVWQQVNILAGRPELLLPIVKRRKLSWFGHVCRHDTMSRIIIGATVDGSRRSGKLRKSWKDIKEWTGQSMSSLQRIVDDRGRSPVIAADESAGVPNGVSPWPSCPKRWLYSVVYVRARGPSSRPGHGTHWHGPTQPNICAYV